MYAALDVRCNDSDLLDHLDVLLAAVDDFAPSAIEERGDAIRVFFANASARDEARRALDSRFIAASVDVPDDDWARRSQEDLAPVTVGRITIVPNPASRIPTNPESQIPNPICLTIQPSM